MNKKYEFTEETRNYNGITLHRIRALRDFSYIKKGSLGGWIEKEDNLSHDGDCWVFGNAIGYNNSFVYENAEVFGNACIYGNAIAHDNSRIYGCAKVYGNAEVCENAEIRTYTCIKDDAIIKSDFDYCIFSGFGIKAISINAYRCKDGSIKVNIDGHDINIDEISKVNIFIKGFDKQYSLIADTIKRYFEEN